MTEKRCSFCGKGEVEVQKLVLGPGSAAICDRCVDLSYGELARDGAAPTPSPAEEAVLEAIPHRPPFLFVDRILDCGETKIRAERTIRADEPQFRGHYPGVPLMPGVLLCEAIIQAGAILVSRALGTSAEGVPVLTRIGEARFKRMVRPGDTALLEAELSERLANAFYFKGRATVEGQRAVTLEFAVTLAPRPSA